jgi:Bacterial archaeo-eukaryotic release factor family 7
MEPLSKADLMHLVDQSTGPCVSLYLPTHRAGAETHQDPIRLKNLLRKAESGLEGSGRHHAEISQLLQPARALLDDYDFWQHQSDSLAILSSPELFRLYRLQLQVPEMVVTSNRFHLKPLLGSFAGGDQYYILALTRNHVRVFRATRESMVEMETRDLPASLTQTLRDATSERRLQGHTAGAASTGRRGIVFHGQGGGDEDRKDRALAYFQHVDEGMCDLLARNRAPVVVAAVDYLHSIYCQANSHAGLLDDWVSGNPDNMSSQELHEKANAVVSAYLTKDREKAADQYLQLWYTGRTSNTLAEILPAAYQGRVQSLFVALAVQQWGRFDEARNETLIPDEPTPQDQDLLNLVAIQTFLTSGSVYPVAADDVPGATNVAAVFRY